jgi:hypothetical protein
VTKVGCLTRTPSLSNFRGMKHQLTLPTSLRERHLINLILFYSLSTLHVFLNSSPSLQAYLKQTEKEVSSQHDHLPERSPAPYLGQAQSFEQHLERFLRLCPQRQCARSSCWTYPRCCVQYCGVQFCQRHPVASDFVVAIFESQSR